MLSAVDYQSHLRGHSQYVVYRTGFFFGRVKCNNNSSSVFQCRAGCLQASLEVEWVVVELVGKGVWAHPACCGTFGTDEEVHGGSVERGTRCFNH